MRNLEKYLCVFDLKRRLKTIKMNVLAKCTAHNEQNALPLTTKFSLRAQYER